MGFGSFLKGAITAPFKAGKALAGGTLGAGKALATGHPIQAGKAMGRGAIASTRPIRRSIRGRR